MANESPDRGEGKKDPMARALESLVKEGIELEVAKSILDGALNNYDADVDPLASLDPKYAKMIEEIVHHKYGKSD